jgi:DNA polymerase-3 subunit gamma/tau
VSTALYRRYRPETFGEVIGQEHVTVPLMQALRSDRVHHAYLFSGPRGCGKTTSARILARCLNCAQGPTDTPCGQCDSCVELARGGPGSLDVVEIDAASHNGVDDARELRERAVFAPARDRFKIFILDEAHMVTPQGFNALLKIVEEPPEHVKFVFATTEPDKVIGTIRSRTHHYPFHLVPPERLLDHLEQVCRAEQVEVGKGVLPLVVRAGGGSVRDSLSVLDQLVAGASGGRVDYETAVTLLGYTHAALLDDVVGAFAVGDGATVFRVVNRVIESGHDPRRFVEDLLERFRDLIVLQALGDGARSIFRALPEDQLDRMQQQAAGFAPATLSRAADLANTALTEMVGATSPRLHLELLCARILLPGAESTERGLAARLDRLERRLHVSLPTSDAQPSVPQPTQPTTQQAPPHPEPAPERTPERQRPHEPVADEHAPEPEHQPEPAPQPEPAGPSAGVAGAEAVRRMWPDVLSRLREIKRTTWSATSQYAQVLSVDEQTLRLGFSNSGALAMFARGAHPELVRQALIDVLGLDVRVEAVPLDQASPATTPPATTPPATTSPTTTSPEPTLPETRPLAATPPSPTTGPSSSGPRADSDPPPDPPDDDPGPPGQPAPRRPAGEGAGGPASAVQVPVAPEDDTWSRDDEDAEDSGLAGPQVVEQILGGRVIEVREGP